MNVNKIIEYAIQHLEDGYPDKALKILESASAQRQKRTHLSKREYFAGMALSGILSRDLLHKSSACPLAIEYADELIQELHKKNYI